MLITELLKGQRFQARSTSKIPASATTSMMSTLRVEGLIFLGVLGNAADAEADAAPGAGDAAGVAAEAAVLDGFSLIPRIFVCCVSSIRLARRLDLGSSLGILLAGGFGRSWQRGPVGLFLRCFFLSRLPYAGFQTLFQRQRRLVIL